MKIWLINHYASDMLFDKGGRHYWIAKFLKKAGHDPIIIGSNAKHCAEGGLFFDDEELWHTLLAEEIDVPFVYIKSRPYVGNGKGRILNMVDFYRNTLKAADQLAAHFGKPDVIYASSVHPLTLVAGIRIARQYGIKCICEVRDLWPESIVAYGVACPHRQGEPNLPCAELTWPWSTLTVCGPCIESWLDEEVDE